MLRKADLVLNQYNVELPTVHANEPHSEVGQLGSSCHEFENCPNKRGVELGLKRDEMHGFQSRRKCTFLLEAASQRSVLPKVPEFDFSFLNQQPDTQNCQ